MTAADIAWQPAVEDHATALAELALPGSPSETDIEQARSFLRTWRVELAIESGTATAAVAVLPPAAGHHRGHGAWWMRGDDSSVIERLKLVATTVPGLRVLQVTAPSDDLMTAARLDAAGFRVAYPVWTMVHDGATWPASQLPAALRVSTWTDVDLRRLHGAYADAYEDQRLVEPHSEDAWARMTADNLIEVDLSLAALDSGGDVAGFVLAFKAVQGVELGPIGTVPAWRGRGVSSALLSVVLARCRDIGTAPITLTVDGDSPTRAQRLYERFGFRTSEVLAAYHGVVGPHDGT